MATVASKSVKASFQPNENKEIYSLKLDGRGTSVLGKSQGDHVTAYALVEEGLRRAVNGISKAEVDELFKLQNRDLLRLKRTKLYDFISNIAVLHPNTESLYLGVDEILTIYNKERTAKTILREKTHSLQADPVLIGSNLECALGNVEQLYNKNGVSVRETLTKVARLVLTFYNHIPHTAYFAIPGFAAAKDEGSVVRTTLPIIEKSIKDCSKLREPPETLAKSTKLGKQLTTIVGSIANLMHYPEITDEEKLGAHRGETLTYGAKRLSKARDNTKESLVNALAKHLHITFAVYPELSTLFTQDEVLKPFVTKMINGKEENKVLWPSFNQAQDIASITQDVSNELAELKECLSQESYTERKDYKELESSDDEDEPTKPRAKVKIEAPEEKNDLQQKLQDLLRYKAIMDEAIKSGSVQLPFALQETLRKECQSLYPEKFTGIKK